MQSGERESQGRNLAARWASDAGTGYPIFVRVPAFGMVRRRADAGAISGFGRTGAAEAKGRPLEWFFPRKKKTAFCPWRSRLTDPALTVHELWFRKVFHDAFDSLS